MTTSGKPIQFSQVMTAPTPASKGKYAQLEIEYPDEAGFLSQDDLAQITPQVLVERIRALRPLIAANAAETERLRRPVSEVWAALRKTGVFYLFMPKRWGGLEFGVQTFIDCMLEIGEVCPSTAWSANFTTEHNWLASHFSEEAQREFFGGGRYISAPGTSTPMGKAVGVPGGYTLNGHYRFASGLMNADWVFAMGLVEGEETPNPRWFAIPANEIKALDSWYVEGLAGTGSNDFLVENVFVPEHRAMAWAAAVMMASEGSKLNANPMYRMPPVQFLSFCVTLTTVGAGRGVVKAYRESVMKGRQRWGESLKQHEKPAAQLRAARADLLAHSAELTLRDMACGMMRMAEGSLPADDLNRTKLVAQAAMAAHLAHEAATVALRGAGTSVHALAHPFQRLMRDINVSSSHAVSEFDEVGEQYGRALFGLEPTSPMR